MIKTKPLEDDIEFEEKIKNPPYRFEFALEQIKKFKGDSKLKILDVGSGDGTFLKILENSGHSISSVEPNHRNRIQISENLGSFRNRVKLYSHLKDIPNGKKFDVITCFEVLEHLRFDPKQLIKDIDKHLEGKGLFIFTTPIEHNLADPDHYWEFNFYDVRDFCEVISSAYEIFFINKTRKFSPLTNLFAAVVRKA